MIIYKYEMPEPGLHSVIPIPKDGKVLHVGMQGGRIMMWVEVNNTATEQRKYTTLPTGTEFFRPPNAHHIGTVFDGPFVWHIYEEIL